MLFQYSTLFVWITMLFYIEYLVLSRCLLKPLWILTWRSLNLLPVVQGQAYASDHSLTRNTRWCGLCPVTGCRSRRRVRMRWGELHYGWIVAKHACAHVTVH